MGYDVPKFSVGDEVWIRPFEEIDHDDIGTLPCTDRSCFAISRVDINSKSVEGPYIVKTCARHSGTYIYRLRRPENNSDDVIDYYWAQGMITGYPCADEIPDADEDELFGFLLAWTGEAIA